MKRNASIIVEFCASNSSQMGLENPQHTHMFVHTYIEKRVEVLEKSHKIHTIPNTNATVVGGSENLGEGEMMKHRHLQRQNTE